MLYIYRVYKNWYPSSLILFYKLISINIVLQGFMILSKKILLFIMRQNLYFLSIIIHEENTGGYRWVTRKENVWKLRTSFTEILLFLDFSSAIVENLLHNCEMNGAVMPSWCAVQQNTFMCRILFFSHIYIQVCGM